MAREYHPKLCIVTRAAMSEAASERISIVLESAQIAALFIAPHGHTPLEAAIAKPLVDVAHEKGIAALIEGDARLARTLRTDGVHLPWGNDAAKQYAEARQITGHRLIVGVDAGRSRHDAMSLGEAGADYVGFGIPAHVEDSKTARRHQLELVEWWSEIFEVPCVAFDVDTPEAAVALARAGADFVVLAIPVDVATEHLGRWSQDLAGALDFQEVAA